MERESCNKIAAAGSAMVKIPGVVVNGTSEMLNVTGCIQPEKKTSVANTLDIVFIENIRTGGAAAVKAPQQEAKIVKMNL